MSKTCKEYQDDLKMNAENDENSRKNIEALEVSHKCFTNINILKNLLFIQKSNLLEITKQCIVQHVSINYALVLSLK